MVTITNTSVISSLDSLLIALVLATIVHAFILLGIDFTFSPPPKANQQIEIILANTAITKAPKKAKYLAPDNKTSMERETKKIILPIQKPKPQKNNNKKQPSQGKSLKKLILPPKAEHKTTTTKKHSVLSSQRQTKLSPAILEKQIAQLGKKIRHSQQNIKQSKIKFVNSVSTHKYIAAQYMKDWELKVERTGNINYPEIARQQGLTGTLVMDVGINANGSLYSIRITQSSGNKVLDEAAKRIVKLSTPFAALPKELLEELNVLVISRIWKFSNESGMTTR